MTYNNYMSAFSKIRKAVQKTIKTDSFELELFLCYGSGSKCNNQDGVKSNFKAHFHGALSLSYKITKELQNEIISAICSVISVSLRGIKRIYNPNGWQDYIESHPIIGKVFKWTKAQRDTNFNEQNAKIIQDLEVNEANNVLTDISATNKTNIDKNINISNCVNIQAPATLIGTIKTFIRKLCIGFSLLRVWV